LLHGSELGLVGVESTNTLIVIVQPQNFPQNRLPPLAASDRFQELSSTGISMAMHRTTVGLVSARLTAGAAAAIAIAAALAARN
jgi:hypothetical protein